MKGLPVVLALLNKATGSQTTNLYLKDGILGGVGAALAHCHDTWALCWGKQAPLVAAHGLLSRCASWALECLGSVAVAHGGLAAP